MNKNLYLPMALASSALLGGCALQATSGEAVDSTQLAACRADVDCHGDGGGGTSSTLPPPQARPPAPRAGASSFPYSTFAFGFDVAILNRLQAPPPADNVPWPLATIPYVSQMPNAPVAQRSVASNLWAFVSIAANGFASNCLGQCSTAPVEVFNENYGTYEATLTLAPRLDVQFWKVVGAVQSGSVVLLPSMVTEVTATLDVRGFAECVGWEKGNGKLHALAGAGNLTIQRDTGILEDIGDFLMPGLTASANAQIRNGLINALGIGQFSSLPMDGQACATLGVTGDALSGQILWNPSLPVFVNGGLISGTVSSVQTTLIH